MGKILSFKHSKDSVDKVDPRLWDIVQHAIDVSPYDAIIRSGSERGPGDKGNHSKGYAVDVTFQDSNGNPIKDIGRNAESAAIYEKYAQAARVYQQTKYPELDKTLRWGGGFRQGAEFDFMHLDITPGAKQAMAYYDWDKGFNSAAQAAIPGLKDVTSSGLSDARTRRQIELAYENAGTVLPPGNIPQVGSETSTGTRTSELQQQLQSRGFDPGPVDGINGPRTKEAVKAFQKANGLAVDGIVGPKTRAALEGGGKSSSNIPSDAMYGVRTGATKMPPVPEMTKGREYYAPSDSSFTLDRMMALGKSQDRPTTPTVSEAETRAEQRSLGPRGTERALGFSSPPEPAVRSLGSSSVGPSLGASREPPEPLPAPMRYRTPVLDFGMKEPVVTMATRRAADAASNASVAGMTGFHLPTKEQMANGVVSSMSDPALFAKIKDMLQTRDPSIPPLPKGVTYNPETASFHVTKEFRDTMMAKVPGPLRPVVDSMANTLMEPQRKPDTWLSASAAPEAPSPMPASSAVLSPTYQPGMVGRGIPTPSISALGTGIAGGAAGLVPTSAPTPKPVKPVSSGGSEPPKPVQTIKGSSTGRLYVVGQIYKNASGNFVAQPDGTFKKVETGVKTQLAVNPPRAQQSSDQRGQAALRASGMLDQFGMIT